MNRPNAAVVESNIPSAAPITRKTLQSGLTVKQARELEDITAWLELQEDAEIELLTVEMVCKNNRWYRKGDRTYG